MFAVLSCWAEPIENSVHAAQRASEGLIAGGDPASTGYAYYASLPGMLDCGPSLDRYLTEAEAAVAFTRRTGNEHLGQLLDPYRWLAGVLLGDSTAAAGEAVPAATTPATRRHSFMLISVMRPLPPSSAIRPAWSGTPRPRCC